MCFHVRIVSTAEEIEEFYDISRSPNGIQIDRDFIYHHANGYDHDSFWVIPQERSHFMTPMMWGLLPYTINGKNYQEYYKKSVRFGAGLNARSEKLFNLDQYRASSLTRRCIIPLNGFFEPHTCAKPKNFKVPFYFENKKSNFVSLAGIYSITPDKYVSFSILTKEAKPDSIYAKIHNNKNKNGQHRQVVPLKKSQLQEWLSNDLNEKDVLRMLGNAVPDSDMNSYSVSKDIFSPKIDSNRPDIIEYHEYPQVDIDND